MIVSMATLTELPSDLPQPLDDGAADHLLGMKLPRLTLQATTGAGIHVGAIPGLLVVYCYPMTGQPNVALPEGLLCGLFLAPSWSGAATFACLYESGGGVAWEGFSRSIQEFPPRRPFFMTESHLTPEAAAVAMNSSNTFVCAKRRASATYCTSDRGETIAFDPLAAKGLGQVPAH